MMSPLRQAYAVTAALAVTAAVQPAFALSSIDPVQGVTSLGQWLFLLAAGIIPCIFLVKGLQAMAQGEHYGRHIAGLLIGLGIALAGYTIMNKWSGGGGGTFL